MLLDTYWDRSGLGSSLPATLKTDDFARAVQGHREALRARVADEHALQWQYRVPELGEGGACSLFGQLAAEPYDLAATLGGRGEASQRLLARATAAVAYYRQHSASHWFGVYQARTLADGSRALVKLAYFGAESRAEFPLTPEFAQISNNSAVGLSGRGRVINDVARYVADGGEYYTCDPKVQAEACLPLFGAQGQVAGIVDSEAFEPGFFKGGELALLLAVSAELSDGLLG
ncbi:MAG: histidine kinase [Roseateles depolymerans]|uniref:Histidine kinase n=1 Tax=Roseateles depolymerans TaxID=76731 RepID=A0A2W5DLL1_9BURK|nr:MAG: histidine kinase [Roseateles depolymerans]